MYIGEQLINPTDARLRLSAQLGCKGIVIDSRPNRDVADVDGAWSIAKVTEQRRRVEGFGMRLDGMALDVGSVLLDSLRARRARSTGCARTFAPPPRAACRC
jgi:mannonate dehydratase